MVWGKDRPCRARPADRSPVAEDRSAAGVRDQTDRAELHQGEDFPPSDRPAAPRSADRRVGDLSTGGFRLAHML
jgi:hypothetical protein